MNKILKVFIVILVFLLTIVFYDNIKTYASTSSIQTLSEQYTKSDNYYYNGTSYSIQDYVTAWNNFDMGRGSGYGQRNVQNGYSYKFDDNDIVNLIPKDLFYTVGTYHYMGEEYGFYIRTIKLQYNYRSYVAVYDIDYTTPNYFSNTSSCNVQMVFNCWYDGMYRETGNPLGNMIVDGKDKAVVYLTYPTANTDKLYLTDISATISVENRDYPNPGDSDYDLIDYSNMKVIDKGDFILLQTCEVNPQSMPEPENPNELNFFEKLLMFGFKKIISTTKVLSPLLWLEYLDPGKTTTVHEYDYVSVVRYGTGYDQLILDEKFIRSGTCKSKPDSVSYNPTFHIGDYFRMTTDLDASYNPEERRIMNLDYDLSISIYDSATGTISTASKSRHFEYTRYMKITYTDEFYSATIDNGIGTTAFYYRSMDNTNLQLLHYSSANLQAKVFDTNGNLINESNSFIYIDSPGEKGFIIIFSGNGGTNVAFSPCKDRSKFLSLSLNSKRVADLNHLVTNFIFSVNDVGVRDYAFFFECEELIGDTIKINDIYGNVIVDEFEVTRKQTYIKTTLNPNTTYTIEVVKSTTDTKQLNLIVFDCSTNYTLTYGVKRDTPFNCTIMDNGYENYTLKVYVSYSDVYNISLYGSQIYNSIPSASLSVYDVNMNLLKRYDSSYINSLSQNDLNDSNFITYLASGYYFIKINCNLNIENLGINISGLSDILTFNDINNYQETFSNDKEYNKVFKPSYNGNYTLSLEYVNDDGSNAILVVYKRNSYGIDSSIQIELTNSNTITYIFENVIAGEEYYICVYGNNIENTLSMTFAREITSNFNVILDPIYITDEKILGSEVTLNNGSRESNIITVGYTRCIFLGSGAPSTSRLDYNWFSSDTDVAIVSPYGTITGKKDGEATIQAVYKNDQTIVSTFNIIIVLDTSNTAKTVLLTTDYRENITHNGTEVNVLLQEQGLTTIHVGYTRAICFLEGSPTNSIQDFVWSSSNSSIATVTSFGMINGVSSGTVIITGHYKYNSNFTATIEITVI